MVQGTACSRLASISSGAPVKHRGNSHSSAVRVQFTVQARLRHTGRLLVGDTACTGTYRQPRRMPGSFCAGRAVSQPALLSLRRADSHSRYEV